MPAEPIQYSGEHVDMSPRLYYSATVAASPAAAAETTICTVTAGGNLAVVKGVLLEGWAAFTAGTNGVSATLKLRQTNTSGTTIATTGALTVVAASLYQFDVRGLDTAAVLPGQVYVLTLTIGSGSAASTVSAAFLNAIVY